MKKLATLCALLCALSAAAPSAFGAARPVEPFPQLPDLQGPPPSLRNLSRLQLGQACTVSGMMVAQGAYRSLSSETPEREGLALVRVSLEFTLASLVWYGQIDDMTQEEVTRLAQEWAAKDLRVAAVEAHWCKDAAMGALGHLSAGEQADLREQARQTVRSYAEMD